jgi:chemotaxis family two-component system response regulator Rcp1
MPDAIAPVDILLVEDNPGDVRLTLESFKDSRVANAVEVRNNGKEALDYLNEQFAHQRALPDLILLDLDMPVMDGRELLTILKQDDRFKAIPVIVLTISPSDQDVVDAYGLHANSYIAKPVEFDDFLEVIKAFEGFWLSVVKFPRREL